MYSKLQFPKMKSRPFFFTNFVSTIDGKVSVSKKTKNYWPIGSKLDYQVLLELRANADVLIHGSQTALWHRTVDTLGKKEFFKHRKKISSKEILYLVISNNPKQLEPYLKDLPSGVKALLVTTKKLNYSTKLFEIIYVENLNHLATYLYKLGYKKVLVEGGAHTLGNFVKEDLMDEIFLTIAPKIFGTEKNLTQNLVEGVLFKPEDVKNYKLISVKKIKNELFLRYRSI